MDVFIATPTYDEWLSMEYVQSIAATGFYMACNKVGFSVNIAPGNPFLDMSRNNLVEAFLASEATDLLFIDADVGWEADKVMRILSHPQEIVGGLVPKRDGRVQIDGDNAFHQNAVTGEMEEGCGGFLFAAKEIPTAFLRIKRSAFERLKTQGVGTELLPWFKIGYKKGEFGEDIYFCRRWDETGEKMWIDPDLTFTHRGGRVWKGNFFDHSVSTGILKQDKAA